MKLFRTLTLSLFTLSLVLPSAAAASSNLLTVESETLTAYRSNRYSGERRFAGNANQEKMRLIRSRGSKKAIRAHKSNVRAGTHRNARRKSKANAAKFKRNVMAKRGLLRDRTHTSATKRRPATANHIKRRTLRSRRAEFTKTVNRQQKQNNRRARVQLRKRINSSGSDDN